ncbi:EI24 domain-containing protein [Brumimicrobium oceani]|uniref:Coproporphyrinogen III oxidase n=1 Tax=Brumimicrobium oceani TaxID=2100725 RepID=A0A2U2XEA4_9FLAO|nr:EI24 domain-containing protein [Brumimicrobium oceani]PWH86138.1 hypothetical protein DIT68_06175 [Brumimicrobium oceani]
MRAINDHFYSLKRSISLLLKGHFLVFFIPGLVIALFFFLYLLTIDTVEGFFGLLNHTPWIGNYMGTAVDSVFSWVNSISIYFYQFTIITLLSPFHTVLSQRVETNENNKLYSSGPLQFIKDILRTIGVAVVGGLIYSSLFLLWTVIAWTFELSFLSPIISAILIAFFTGFNSYDYALERHNVTVKESWKFAFRNPTQMILTGLIFTGLLYIPIIGVVVAPVLLTMVGTINYIRINKI